MPLPMNDVNNATITAPQLQYLQWLNNYQGQEGANQQALGNNYYGNFLNQATGTGATSAQAGANAMMAPVDNSWIFKSAVGSGKQANALGMNDAAIENMNAQQKQNYVQMLLRFMPQFNMPYAPSMMGSMGAAQRPPMGGTVFHGLEGINNWSGNATTTPSQDAYSPEDQYAVGNPHDSALMNEGINSSNYGKINQFGPYQRPATTPEQRAQYDQMGIPYNQALNRPNSQYAKQMYGGGNDLYGGSNQTQSAQPTQGTQQFYNAAKGYVDAANSY